MLRLLTEQDGEPVGLERLEGKSPVVLVCEHASRQIPVQLGTLELDADALQSHIAWDPGALAVSRLLSEALDATLVFQRFSRLVYDCNRPPESPAAMPSVSEIYIIPANAALSNADRQMRVDEIYTPFHRAIHALIQERLKGKIPPVLVTIHSFTPVYHGVPRTVELGILHDADSRLADTILSQHSPFRTLRNAPYGPQDGVTHTLKLHAAANGLLNVMIEIRNDLLSSESGQRVMADTLAAMMGNALSELTNHKTQKEKHGNSS